MRVRDQLALNLAPIFLRVMLAVTFFWAGLGKVVATTDLSPADAARLANIGGPLPAATSPSTQPPVQLPDPQPDPQPEPQPEPESDATGAQAASGFAFRLASQPADADADPESGAAPAELPEPVRAFGPADFPGGMTVKRLYGLALQIDHAAFPGLDDQSEPLRPIWPSTLAEKPWPVALAWTAAITELVIGVTLLIGLLTRLSALQVVGIMGVAMWLTQIGPAIQSGSTHLGFLPAHNPYDPGAWMPLLWQFSLFAAGLCLLFLGPGSTSMDKLLFGRGGSSAPAPKRDRSNP